MQKKSAILMPCNVGLVRECTVYDMKLLDAEK